LNLPWLNKESEFTEERDAEEQESHDRHGNQVSGRQRPLEGRSHLVVVAYIDSRNVS